MEDTEDCFSLVHSCSARTNASHVELPPAPPVWFAEDVFSIILWVNDFSSFFVVGGSVWTVEKSLVFGFGVGMWKEREEVRYNAGSM